MRLHEIASKRRSSPTKYIITYDLHTVEKQNRNEEFRNHIYDLYKDMCQLSNSSYVVAARFSNARDVLNDISREFEFVNGDRITVGEVPNNIEHRNYTSPTAYNENCVRFTMTK